MDALRLFVAIEVAPGLRGRILEIEEELARCGADVKWVPGPNLHLTLKFLGETPRAKLDPVKAAMEGATRNRSGFELSFSGVGAFPNTRQPRVIWIGVERGHSHLHDLAAAVDDALAGVGFAREDKGFTPHLTIGRVRSGRNLHALSEAIEGLSPGGPSGPGGPGGVGRGGRGVEVGSMDVSRVLLMESKLRPQGPVYSVLAEYALR
ncbi:MAG TPA: RNA 2',3'-cyclic phosphodiesterase [Firmicutes bacterium]|nr:RNA 2',3'-cyclic phosphodiesterase [Bacillota bacterium]